MTRILWLLAGAVFGYVLAVIVSARVEPLPDSGWRDLERVDSV